MVFLHLAAAILLLRKTSPVHRICAAFMADFAVMCFSGSVALRANFAVLHLNLLPFLSLTLLAPLGGALALGCLGAARSPVGRWLLRGIWAATALVFGLSCLLLARGVPWLKVSDAVYGLLVVVFLTIAGVEWFELRPIRRLPQGLRRFYLLTCLSVPLVGGMILAQRTGYFSGLYILWGVLIVSLMGIVLITFRYPELYETLESEAAQVRVNRSRLAGMRVDDFIGRLDAVMRSRRLFADPNLRAETLADAVGVSRPQLSELLSQHLGRNFSSYVNGMRVEAAKELLASGGPPSTILEVAFACGFSSKSTFNAAFRRETGETPTEYRERIQGKFRAPRRDPERQAPKSPETAEPRRQ